MAVSIKYIDDLGMYNNIKHTFTRLKNLAFTSRIKSFLHNLLPFRVDPSYRLDPPTQEIYDILYRMGGKPFVQKVEKQYFGAVRTDTQAKENLKNFESFLKRSFVAACQKKSPKKSVLQPFKHAFNHFMERIESPTRIRHVGHEYEDQRYEFYNISPAENQAKNQRRTAKRYFYYPFADLVTIIMALGSMVVTVGGILSVFTNPLLGIPIALLEGTATFFSGLTLVNHDTRKKLVTLFYDGDMTAGLLDDCKKPWQKAALSATAILLLFLAIMSGALVGIAIFAYAIVLPATFPFISSGAAMIIGGILGVSGMINFSCTLYAKLVDAFKRLVHFFMHGDGFNQLFDFKKRWKQFKDQTLEYQIETILGYGIMLLLLPLVVLITVVIGGAGLVIAHGLVVDFFAKTLMLSPLIATWLAHVMVYVFPLLSVGVFCFESLYSAIVGSAQFLASTTVHLSKKIFCSTTKQDNTPALTFRERIDRAMEYAKDNPWLIIKSLVMGTGFVLLGLLVIINAIGTGIHATAGTPIVVKVFKSLGMRINKLTAAFTVATPAAAFSVGANMNAIVPLYEKQLPMSIAGFDSTIDQLFYDDKKIEDNPDLSIQEEASMFRYK